jgi:hypothetical protein
VLVEFSELGGVEADVEWLADRQDLPGAYLGVQGVFAAIEGEDGDLRLGFEVDDPVDGDSRSGVLADFADTVNLLAAAAGGDYLGD